LNITAQQLDPGEDEFAHAKLEKEDARGIPVPLVKESPVRFECQFERCIELPGNPPMGTVSTPTSSHPPSIPLSLHFLLVLRISLTQRPKVDIIFGKVLAVHISDTVLTDGKIDISKTEPIARLGYYDYAVIRDTFEMKIPGTNKALLDGLEGSSSANRRLEKRGKEEEGERKVEKRAQVERSLSAGAEGGIGRSEE
jgi:flavin reductase (DIM6/NTAB) family NADH-FMN oxidoreductase RutF